MLLSVAGAAVFVSSARRVLDMSTDYLVWDNVEPILFESTRKAATPILDAIAVAKVRVLTSRELLRSGGVYNGEDRKVIFPKKLLTTGLAPKEGDVSVRADGSRWTCLEVQFGKWDQTWMLTSRNLVLAADLRDTIDIQRAQISYDAAGAAVKTFPPTGGSVPYRSLPARVQLLTDEVVDERGIRGFKGTHVIIVGKEVAVTPEDRVAWVSGGKTVLFDIVGYHDAQRIDELPKLDCELRP